MSAGEVKQRKGNREQAAGEGKEKKSKRCHVNDIHTAALPTRVLPRRERKKDMMHHRVTDGTERNRRIREFQGFPLQIR